MSPKGSTIGIYYKRTLTLHPDSLPSSSACNVEKCFIIAPENISTKIPTMCQQHDVRFSLTYSLASALFYYGLEEEAFKLVSKAVTFSSLRPTDMLAKIKEHMQSISIVTEYPKGHERKKASMNLETEARFGGRISLMALVSAMKSQLASRQAILYGFEDLFRAISMIERFLIFFLQKNFYHGKELKLIVGTLVVPRYLHLVLGRHEKISNRNRKFEEGMRT